MVSVVHCLFNKIWRLTKSFSQYFRRNLFECVVSRFDCEKFPVFYLTISRRRRGDYKLIFTEPRSGEMNIRCNITEPEATNCFSINFQVTIDRFFVFIFDCLMFTWWIWCENNGILYIKSFLYRIWWLVSFLWNDRVLYSLNFVFCYRENTESTTAAILNKNTKAIVTGQPVTIAPESANLDQSDGRKINSHLKIYTKAF